MYVVYVDQIVVVVVIAVIVIRVVSDVVLVDMPFVVFVSRLHSV